MNETEGSVFMFTPQYDIKNHPPKEHGRPNFSGKRKNKRKQRIEQEIKQQKNDKNNTCEEISKWPIWPFEPLESETESLSQGSVSLLKECYQENKTNAGSPEAAQTYLNSELEMISVISDKESDEVYKIDERLQSRIFDELLPDCGLQILEGMSNDEVSKVTRVEKIEQSTQTDFSIFAFDFVSKNEKRVAKHKNFLACIIKLRFLLTSEVSTKYSYDKDKLWSNSHFGSDNEETSNEICKINNSLQKSSAYCNNVNCNPVISVNDLRESVSSLLKHLENSLEEDLSQITLSWKNSLYESAVLMINSALKIDSDIRELVNLFLGKVIASILYNEQRLQVRDL